MHRLAVLELNNSDTTIAQLQCKVALTLTIYILAMPLLLTILIVCSNLTLEYL